MVTTNATQLPPFLQYFSDVHSLNFTPAGLWDFIDNKKKAIDANRVNNLSWADYPSDNMAKIKLPEDILVLDIDSVETTIDTTNSTITIPSIGLTLPIGLYTQTSKEGSYHIYYRTAPKQRKRIGYKTIVGIVPGIDILQNYLVFEWHSFSPHNELHEGDILPLPIELQQFIEDYIAEHELTTLYSHQDLQITTNFPLAKAVKAFINSELHDKKQWKNFFQRVFPKEYYPLTPTGRKKAAVTWDDFTLNYDLINKIAVKLTTTKELSYYDHVLPALNLIITHLGGNPNSTVTKQKLRMMLPSLPQHEEILPFDKENDLYHIEEFIEQQADTKNNAAIFRTIYRGTVYYIDVDKNSLEPIEYNGEYFYDQKAAQVLHNERIIYNEDGIPKGWDDRDIPVVEITTDPYEPEFFIDDNDRGVINLSRPSKYIKEKEPRKITHNNNFIYNVVRSTVHPDYLDLVLYWYAQTIFGKVQPSMILWMATGQEMGGTGKSMITATIPGKILQQQMNTVRLKLLATGYDVTENLRMLSAEEGEDSEKGLWSNAYNTFKQLLSGVYAKTNSKYGKMSSRIIKIAISGSSNSRPQLPASDRRFLCLEPAHLGVNPATKPVTEQEVRKLNEFERDTNGKYDDELQEFTNHLYSMWLEGIPDKIHGYLMNKAPETPYRKDWIEGGMSNTASIVINLGYPDELFNLFHIDRLKFNAKDLIDSLNYLIYMYDEDKQKVVLSYKFFEALIKLVHHDEDLIDLTPKNISNMLGRLKFSTPSPWAKDKHKEFQRYTGLDWPMQMHAFNMNNEAINRYMEIVKELQVKYLYDAKDDGLGKPNL